MARALITPSATWCLQSLFFGFLSSTPVNRATENRVLQKQNPAIGGVYSEVKPGPSFHLQASPLDKIRYLFGSEEPTLPSSVMVHEAGLLTFYFL
jgi:hypothetical protein